MFDEIDTEEKAYWLGFIYADGSICSDPLNPEKKARYAFEISLKGDDYKHLEKFNTFMEHRSNNVKISNSKCNGKTFKRCRWMIANKHLWNTLNNYGCTPNKSLTLEFPDESIFKDKSLIRHFIRGYFDGDGCFTRQVHRTIVSPAVSMLGTPEFLKTLSTYLDFEVLYRQDKRRSERTLIMEFHLDETIKFINYLYKDANIYLDRKYKLYEFFELGSRSVEEFTELLSGNIGETPEMDNTEINSEIKESESSYSVEVENYGE